MTGPAGQAGTAGLAGATGPAGTSGATGPEGSGGPGGAPGTTGPAGVTGPKGSGGPSGASGEAGPAGPAGPAGLDTVVHVTAPPATRHAFRAALRLRRGQTRASLGRAGLLVQVGCDLACSTTITVTDATGHRLARRATTLPRPGRREVAMRVPRATHGRLTIRTAARSADGQRRAARRGVEVR